MNKAEVHIPSASISRSRGHTKEFKISPAHSTKLASVIKKRVTWHRFTASILMFAALFAIASGIGLIFYAGELVKQQRDADIPILIDRANELNKQADKIKSDAEGKIQDLNSLDRELEFTQQTLNDYNNRISQASSADQSKLDSTKTAPNIDDLKSSVAEYSQRVNSLRDRIASRDASIKSIQSQRDVELAPVIESEKQLNQKISGTGAVLEYNAIIIRVSAVLLIVFLVQTFITIFRYITRLAAYYQARVDALVLAADVDVSIRDLHTLATIFSPEGYDFGRLPRGPVDQAIDIARTIISSQRRGKDTEKED